MLAFLFVSLAAAQSTSATGFVTSDATCGSIKQSLCWSDPTAPVDQDCMEMDFGIMQVLLQMPMLGGSGDYLCPLPTTDPCADGSFGPGFVLDATTAPILAFFGFAVSVFSTAHLDTPLTQIHPILNSIYECEARAAGLVWADYAGTWTMAQSCMNDADCMTALTNIRTVSSNKDEMNPGMNKKAEAVWDEVSLIGMWLPLQKDNALCDYDLTNLFCNGHEGNDNDQLCNIVFAALAEENVLALTWIMTATALMFNDPDEIVAHCNDTMAKGIAMLLGLTIAGASIGGILLTAITCCCINKSSSKQDAI